MTIILIAVITLNSREQSTLYGTILDPPIPAPNFSLQNHLGNEFNLAEHKGTVIILTFLYTSCVDICPFIAQKLRLSHETLENESLPLTIVAITTDPERDTIQRTSQYSSLHGMTNKWHFLFGSHEELEPIWKGYFTSVLRRQHSDNLAKDIPPQITELIPEQRNIIAQNAINSFGGGYLIDHSSPIFIIDQKGFARVLMGADFSPSELSNNIRLLLNQ